MNADDPRERRGVVSPTRPRASLGRSSRRPPYATRKGWTGPETWLFVDDGISGAEFANCPGFVRLMASLKPRPPFQVLIMSEESRLGREAIETAYALKQLITAGVRVFFYLEDRERTFDPPTD
jgi:DNA invertase Pin-like site-specific DNA recombinase